MKKAKRKKTVRGRSRTPAAGWGTFFVLGAAFGVAVWFVLNPFMSDEANVVVRLMIVLVIAVLCSAFATYLLNSTLAAWSKWRRRRG